MTGPRACAMAPVPCAKTAVFARDAFMRAVWTMMTPACLSADIAGGAPPLITPAPRAKGRTDMRHLQTRMHLQTRTVVGATKQCCIGAALSYDGVWRLRSSPRPVGGLYGTRLFASHWEMEIERWVEFNPHRWRIGEDG